jgi:NADPH:quinone reductase-like Zn-dependent oxidoreductase
VDHVRQTEIQSAPDVVGVTGESHRPRDLWTAELLHLDEVPLPNVGDGDVLVRVQAASANAGDWHLLRGTPLPFRLVAGLRKPKIKIIGNDIAGRVEAVGRNVTQFRPGDHVFGELSRCDFGAYAEFAVAPEKALALKPANLSFEEAAAIPTAGCTALQGLRKGRIERARRVLIKGASDGVGRSRSKLPRRSEPR